MEKFYNVDISNSLRESIGLGNRYRHSFGTASDEVEELYEDDVTEPRLYCGFEGGLVLLPKDDSVILYYLEKDTEKGLEDLDLAAPMSEVDQRYEASTAWEAKVQIEEFFKEDMKRKKVRGRMV